MAEKQKILEKLTILFDIKDDLRNLDASYIQIGLNGEQGKNKVLEFDFKNYPLYVKTVSDCIKEQVQMDIDSNIEKLNDQQKNISSPKPERIE